jgi:hypothetical protein
VKRQMPTAFVLTVVLAALALGGCAQQRYEQLFAEHFGRAALECLHPAGEFQSASEVAVEADDVFTGTIYWRGTALGNNYFTKVRVKVREGIGTVYVLEESSLLPAINQDCQIPLEPPPPAGSGAGAAPP